jgi:hypothetical protein
MNIDIATKSDIEALKEFLIQALKEFTDKQSTGIEKEYLRSREVRQLLKISNGTLNSFRIRGLLTPIKVDTITYYKLSEIKALLRAGTD